MLELDPRNAVALGFLGIAYHLLGDLDNAIVKYHEVNLPPFLKDNILKKISSTLFFIRNQALSIDPINAHVLELLNSALESNTMTFPHHKAAAPTATGSDVDFKDAVKLLRTKYARMAAGKGVVESELPADIEMES